MTDKWTPERHARLKSSEPVNQDLPDALREIERLEEEFESEKFMRGVAESGLSYATERAEAADKENAKFRQYHKDVDVDALEADWETYGDKLQAAEARVRELEANRGENRLVSDGPTEFELLQQRTDKALEKYKEASWLSHAWHYRKTDGQCPDCVRATELRNEAEKILEPRDD